MSFTLPCLILKNLEQRNIKDIIMSLNSIYKEEVKMKVAKFSKALTVTLQPEVFELIKQITDEKQISLAEWVRDAIEAAIKNELKVDEIK
jgi:predicted HicB family RNase H-like nuclease